ncbi:membrane protein [Massilia varians]|uniref:Membrane protein n=1 Tax=Massilia varians TaxID=457921 RepID=A0ABN6T5C4_9BURK|nr:TolC family protein [Massilia varians]BDT57417.1 membrane protein [Massilia varians]
MVKPSKTCITPLALALACCAVLPVRAQQTGTLDYGEAWRRMQVRSGAVRGAELDYQARQLQAEALRRIDGPDLRLNGFAGRLSTSLNIDTGRLAQSLEPALQPVLEVLPPLPGLALPELPASLEAERTFTVRSLGLASVWPLYTGGRLDALKEVAAGRAAEAGAGLQTAQDEAALLLAQRYFGVQLARHAARLRTAALAVAREHQEMARKLERTGLIARVERLKADVAVDKSAREAAKAASDAEVAELALRRLLGEEQAVEPATPLFVHEQPVGSLASFVEAAMHANAAWKQIDSKRAQAAANLKLQGKAFSPTLVGIANYNLNRGGAARANWLVGVALSMPLVDRVDRARLTAAARLEQQRVEAAAEQAGRDIPTLAETQWRAMEDARQHYLAMASAIELARESLRLAQVSFRNGQATTADVDDASLNLTKAGIERTQAAHDYVLALARLLATTGRPERLVEHARSAPHQLDPAKESTR